MPQAQLALVVGSEQVLKDATGQLHGQSHPMAEDARQQFLEGQPLACRQGRAHV